MNRDASVTLALARFAVAASGQRLSPAVTEEAKRCFLNFVGCAIGGHSHPATRTLAATMLPFSGTAQATVVGAGLRTDAMLAALLNGASASAHAFDDTHAVAVVHAGSPVGAASFAAAEFLGASGDALLTAMAMGVEVTFRASQAISVPPAKPSITWYQSSIAGTLGAAVAAGLLLALDEEQMESALGIATGMACGSRVIHATMTMPLLAGHAAQNGFRAALLARNGFEGPRDAIGAPHGFAAVFSSGANLDAITSGLGQRFELLSNLYKPYPCGVVLHPLIEACQALHAKGMSLSGVQAIILRLSPVAAALTDRAQPVTLSEAQVSAQHWAVVALRTGQAGLAQSSDDMINLPEVCDLRGKVVIRVDEALTQQQVQVGLDFGSAGTVWSDVVDGCAPMTDRRLDLKYREQASQRYADHEIDGQLLVLRDLANVKDIAELRRCF